MKKIFYLIALVSLVFASCTKPGNDHNGERKYSFSIGANKAVDTDNSSKTRIEIINEDLYWSVGDKVGMFIGTISYGQPTNIILDDFALTGQHQNPTKNATFKGELTYDQISQFNDYDKYTYTSYYPYDMWVEIDHVDGDAQDRFCFEIPQEMELTPNEFPHQYAFMFDRQVRKPALTWLDESTGQQRFLQESVPFHYRHVLAYLRLKIINNKPTNPVVNIFMESLSDYGNPSLSDVFYLHLYYNMVSAQYVNPSRNTRNITIPDGLNLGDDLYIPMAPSSSSTYQDDIAFTFELEDGTNIRKVLSASDVYLSLYAGSIYPITFNLGYNMTHDSNTLEELQQGSGLGTIN